MAPLEALERDFPLIDSNFRRYCASHSIFTVEDFLVHDLCALEAFAEQDRTADQLKMGISQMLHMLENQQRPLFNGIELLEDARQNKSSLPTGCKSIDILLQGGIHEGHVTELVGPSSSGKTQVCLKAASHVATNYAGTVMYFDSGNSFSPRRIADFLGQSLNGSKNQVDSAIERAMNSIICHSVFDIFTLFDMLHQLNNFKSQIGCQVRMLIIDSLSSLIAPVLGSGGAHGHGLMIAIGFMLKELAHEHNLSILVTNHMVAGEAGGSKPALGESWKSIPHVRLLLSRHSATKASCISILKHPFLASGSTVEFMIT